MDVYTNVAYVHMYESFHHMARLKFQTSLLSNLAKTLSESVRIWNISIAVCSTYIYHTCRYTMYRIGAMLYKFRALCQFAKLCGTAIVSQGLQWLAFTV